MTTFVFELLQVTQLWLEACEDLMMHIHRQRRALFLFRMMKIVGLCLDVGDFVGCWLLVLGLRVLLLIDRAGSGLEFSEYIFYGNFWLLKLRCVAKEGNWLKHFP